MPNRDPTGRSQVPCVFLVFANAMVFGCASTEDPPANETEETGTEPTSTEAGLGKGSATGGSDAEAPSGAASTATDAVTDTGASTGSNEGCVGGCSAFPLDCSDVECGGLSVYDENGCVRPNCAEPGRACAAGEVCYIEQAFGGCVSGGLSCTDDFVEMQCVCGGSGDCGGGYCIPVDLHPEARSGPSGTAIVEDVCTKDGIPAFAFTIGPEIEGCTPEASESVYLRLDGIDAAPGTHALGQLIDQNFGVWRDGVGTSAEVSYGFVTIDAWEDDVVSGSYYVYLGHLDRELNYSGVFEATPCLTGTGCG